MQRRSFPNTARTDHFDVECAGLKPLVHPGATNAYPIVSISAEQYACQPIRPPLIQFDTRRYTNFILDNDGLFGNNNRMKKEKNQAAVAMGKLSAAKAGAAGMAERGRKGGNARAKALTPEQRSELARNAINARWAKAKAENKKG